MRTPDNVSVKAPPNSRRMTWTDRAPSAIQEPDLAGAPVYRVRHHAIHTNRGQYQRDEATDGYESRRQFFDDHGLGKVLVQCG